MDYFEGCKMLEEAGFHQDVNEDLDTENEKSEDLYNNANIQLIRRRYC